MTIKGGKVLRTATAAARRFQQKQFSATSSASLATPPVTPTSGVGTFLGIPKLIRSEADLLISKYVRISQKRLTKKGAYSEEKLRAMFSGGNDVVGIHETMKFLDGKIPGDFTNKPHNVRSIAKSTNN
ncbi:hypothetical protein AALP_AA1G193400 [Arabis alpina]|uniref:Uncharacterized protein n=1 Tax=Arabis alpina TaxID=50452 RepID=A0A087HP81_ARAAL|nr:hypothetical protein AALP_AA1G193400 [Arabis alpina]